MDRTYDTRLLHSYGPLMTADEAAAVLKFPSRNALRMAIGRRQLSLRPMKLPQRRGSYFATSDVANVLRGWVGAAEPREIAAM